MIDKVIVLSHNIPTEQDKIAGIWIANLWEGAEFVRVSKYNPFSYLNALQRVRKSPKKVVAYWMYPSGVLAWLSGKSYILCPVGMDIFHLIGSCWLRWLLVPILNKAEKLVFIGDHPLRVFNSIYGSRYANKSLRINLPLGTPND